MRFWPSNAKTRRILVAGVDPVAQGTVALVDRTANRGMQGLSGHIPAGNGFSLPYKLSGYLAYDTLAMTRMVGASRNRVSDPNIALPATGGAVVVGSVQESLASIPAGYR